ncbi:hypothetical protein [Streptomyces sp. NPDC052042]|uniref:hypothetical protein n=1 Tax=Streptomyces sp. NPDC052042 TaxID=3365683 RepID=UPI0037D5DCF2
MSQPPEHPVQLARLVEEFHALPADDDRRLEIIAALDPGGITTGTAVDAALFLASVVADPHAYELARVEAATILRLWPPSDPAAARSVVRALLSASNHPDEDLVRQYAVHALGSYADEPAVHEALAAAVLDDDGDEDTLVRHNALAALEEAGPSDARSDVLRALAPDPELGRAAARVLTAWDRTPDAPA